MIPLEQVSSITARWLPVLAKHGISDVRAFAEADAGEVELWFADAAVDDPATGLERWPKAYQVRWMQAEALALAEAEQPSPPKWFLAIHDLSVEGTVPFYDVRSGEKVNLFYRSDEQIENLIAQGVVAPLDAGLHLLTDETWLPAVARRQLNLGGIYTLEAMLSGKAVLGTERAEPEKWLSEVETNPETVARWLSTARERVSPVKVKADKEPADMAQPNEDKGEA